MVYQVDEIVKDVRVCIDENMDTDALFATGDIDALKLDEVIESKILEAVERVESMAPYYLLEEGHDFADASIDWGSGYWGAVSLPEDFMRLIVFEMSDWERPAYDIITPADAAYKMQRSRIKALRGNAQRPVVALVMSTTGKTLEFYSCKSDTATVTKAMYVPHPEIDSNDGVDISEKCYKAVVEMAAGLTLTSCGESDKANLMLDMAKTYLEK